jgi:riboflavin synthase
MGGRVFTGLVEKTGVLGRRVPRGTGFRLEITTDIGPLVLGESVSVNGACLTAVTLHGPGDGKGFAADVSVETHERTTLGAVAVGEPVNLERALAVGDRLGGHLVSGHVDGVAAVNAVARDGEALRVMIDAPRELMPYVAAKGSVTLDGVSLTVNRVEGARFEIMLIPHTVAVTTLRTIAPGRRLNLEVDLVARYVVRYLEARSETSPKNGLEEALSKAGYVR